MRRSTADPENELAEAWRALDAAAAVTVAAQDAVWTTRTDAQERRAWVAWENALKAQNRAAGRLHNANRALGRPACDDRREWTCDDCGGQRYPSPIVSHAVNHAPEPTA